MAKEAAKYDQGHIWAPQPGPQFFAVTCPMDIVFFGGARGGGKTDAALGRQIIGASIYGSDWNGLFLRKHFKHFADLRRRIDGLIAAGLPAVRVGGDNQTNLLRFANGARVMMTAIERSEQLEFFQGQSFTSISIEEVCQFSFVNDMIDKMKACLRSAAGVPCSLFLTGNPGGPGHGQVKNRFISPSPLGGRVIDDGGDKAIFIPSNVFDNKILVDSDPKYLQRLQSIRDPALRKAWLEGDWDAVVGGYFDDVWNVFKHVLPRFTPPAHWPRMCGMDWGTAKPFSVGWYAVSDGQVVSSLGRAFPKGSVVRYGEWYGAVKDDPNTGLRLTSYQVAEGIRQKEALRGEADLVFDRIADSSIFDQDDGPSIGERFAERGVVWRKADKRRVPGWEQFRVFLRGAPDGTEGDFTPMFYVTENCKAFIETVPSLERDSDNWEDVDSDGIDHVADEARYVLMSRVPKGRTPEEALRDQMEESRSVHDSREDWDEITGDPIDDEDLY